jgi:hypothetical protein
VRLCARGFAHISQLKRFVDCKRVGAGKLDKEQIVLNEVVTKGRLSQSAISHPSGERGARCRRATQRTPLSSDAQRAHGLLPDLLDASELDCLLYESRRW